MHQRDGFVVLLSANLALSRALAALYKSSPCFTLSFFFDNRMHRAISDCPLTLPGHKQILLLRRTERYSFQVDIALNHKYLYDPATIIGITR